MRYTSDATPTGIGSIYDNERKETYLRKMSIATVFSDKNGLYRDKITNALNLHEELSKKEPHKRTKAELIEIIKKYL